MLRQAARLIRGDPSLGECDEGIGVWTRRVHEVVRCYRTAPTVTDPTAALAEALAKRAGLALVDIPTDALQTFVERARGGHPDFVVSARWWAEQLWPSLADVAPGEWGGVLERLIAPDLLLAVALGSGTPEAVEVFEQQLVPRIRSTLGRLRLSSSELSEMLQQVRVHILVAPNKDERPRISKYGGRGSLEGWVRTLALRYAIGQRRKQERTIDAGALERVAVPAGTERLPHRSLRRRQLRAAVGDAFSELSPRDRTLLRARYVGAKTAVALATEFDVHESTMSRWLASAREELATRIRARAQVLIGPDDDAVGPMVETLISDVEASLRGLFDTRTPTGTDGEK